MRKLDFISIAPRLSIFKAGANKTNFGGFLFLIYILILLLLAIIYIFDYSSKENYSFEYNLFQNDTKTLKNQEILDATINHNYDFTFYLSKDNRNHTIDLSENDNFLLINSDKLGLLKKSGKNYDPNDGFTIINPNDECVLNKSQTITQQLDDPLIVLYRCHGSDGKNCIINDKDKIKVDSYRLTLGYRGFSLDHQNTEPIQLIPEGYEFRRDIEFLENTNIIYLNWKIIEYKEKKGVFGKLFDNIRGNNNTYYGLQIGSVLTYTDDGHMKEFPSNYLKIKDQKGNHFIVLLYLEHHFLNDVDKYTRKAKSFLDVLTNVCALGSTVLNLMVLSYSFLYSKSYDNYKIIENILTKNMRININNNIKENTNLSPEIELKTDLIEDKNEENESEKEKLNIDNDKKTEEHNIYKTHSENIDLPPISFFDFLFHKFCFKCFGLKKQLMINSCDDFVAKYLTVEKLIYNQIKLEYLWKDYKWNNKKFEIKEKDDLLLDLSLGIN